MTAFLLQNASKVYYKIRQVFMTGCDTFITKCDSYYKLRRFYYKVLQLLQKLIVHAFCMRIIYNPLKQGFLVNILNLTILGFVNKVLEFRTLYL